ncbi:site-specific integrase [Treponema sp.]|uniref:tyrosine-type recombinase/integrase n=1 Tax=Treponema sp. TaxID=166 RepID=UPI0025EABE74|nr:site-specific integrase [Treponema sp.]MCR5218592.1 site-specific integrase [Treponema sp.]
MNDFPFYLYRRKTSPFWSVRFKLESGCYTSGKSTKKTDKTEAEKIAFQWLISGEYKESAKASRTKKFKNDIRKLDIGDDDLLYVLQELQRRNIVSKIIINDAPDSVDALQFVRDFWDWDKSPYVAEKLRQGHSIHMTHVKNMKLFIERYWSGFLTDKKLGEITRKDIESQVLSLAMLEKAPHSKNQILRSLLTPLKWAANHEIITKDITHGIVFFAGKYKERRILTPELAHALFSVKWSDERARLANLVAMLTGMRAGEIRALQLRDLGQNCIYIRHSWNDDEGLKCPKNGEERLVQFPFPDIMEDLKDLYYRNPYEPNVNGLEGFIFWSTLANQPIDQDIFVKHLRRMLVKIGLSEESAKTYTFHAWRHFFTTYMSTKVDTKLLQMQTGHKTKAMLEHYAAHQTPTDYSAIQQAQKEVFATVFGIEQ